MNKSTDPELSISEFVKAVKEGSPFGLAMMLIQRAIDNKSLTYKDYQWFIVTGTKFTKLYLVPPHQDKYSKKELAYYILTNPDKYEMVKSLAPEYIPVNEGEEDMHVYEREELEGMEWFAIKKVAVKLGVSKKEDKNEDVIDKILAQQAINEE